MMMRLQMVILADMLLFSVETTALSVSLSPLRAIATPSWGLCVSPRRSQRRQVLASVDGQLWMEGVAIVAFASSHIGMSSIREPIIRHLGEAADACGIVGTGLRLPERWQGDSSGNGNSLLPDKGTAGRQIYRIVYSVVSAVTLSAAFNAYLRVAPSAVVFDVPTWRPFLVLVASLSTGLSVASLGNPSPLSLVPGFARDPASPIGIVRDDSLKLRPFGLTRLTRHPLILPLVPWGVANSFIGGEARDFVLFGGLAIYALCGCYAQDLRAREAAAVGTVFAKGDLTEFYASTSFLPFVAIASGRQDFGTVLSELPLVFLFGGMIVGVLIEGSIATFLLSP